MNPPDTRHRPVRSFVRREGRITAAQRRAVDTLLPEYGVPDGAGVIDFNRCFGRAAPLHLEIGFGNGDALAAMAAAHPQHNYLGIEVHRPGVGALLRRLQAEALVNVRVAVTDAREFLDTRVAAGSCDAVYVFFPDPWHKQRHHKRRLIQSAFVALLGRVLKSGGTLHLATDWEDYARQMLAVLGADPVFENLAGRGRFAPRPSTRLPTRFERRGQRLGHAVWDLEFRRIGP